MSFERLQDNPFFVAARDVHNDLLDRCADEQLVLCVPQINSLDAEITSRDVLGKQVLLHSNLAGNYVSSFTCAEAHRGSRHVPHRSRADCRMARLCGHNDRRIRRASRV